MSDSSTTPLGSTSNLDDIPKSPSLALENEFNGVVDLTNKSIENQRIINMAMINLYQTHKFVIPELIK